MVCEIIVVVFIIALFGILKSRLSVDKPGKLQHMFELIYEFVHASAKKWSATAAENTPPSSARFFCSSSS